MLTSNRFQAFMITVTLALGACAANHDEPSDSDSDVPQENDVIAKSCKPITILDCAKGSVVTQDGCPKPHPPSPPKARCVRALPEGHACKEGDVCAAGLECTSTCPQGAKCLKEVRLCL